MIPVNVLAVRYLANAEPGLGRALGAPEGYPALGILTTDSDDATYIALDEATKAADVKVCYARSFYAGAANASTPNAGEVIGIIAGPTPGAMRSGMEAALSALNRVGFEETHGVPYLAHTVSSCGSYLAKEAGVRQGSALAYLIAPPLESMYALDAALKAADVVPDFRYPNVIRLAPVPLYVRYVDVYELVQRLKTIMDTGAHLAYENKAGTVA